MYVTWTALRCARPQPEAPWRPEGARFWQAGHAAPGHAAVPRFDGTWWTVLATWDDEQAAAGCPAEDPDVDAWHVVLEPVSYHGDAVLSGGARPFDALPPRGRTTGASAVITLAGLDPDPQRSGEFFERFAALGQEVRDAPGHRAALVQAPDDGAVLTFSAWETLRSAVTWAYHRPRHAETVQRQQDHGLLASTGFLRCAVRSSRGTLGDVPDPLAGLTGEVVRPEERT